MAALSQTITNTMGVHGVSPGTLWGEAVWGTSLWGVDEDVETHTNKGIAEGMSFADALGKDFVKAPIAESLTLSSNIMPIVREWGIWDYIFTYPSADGSSQVTDQFTKVSDNSSTYVEVTTDETEWT